MDLVEGWTGSLDFQLNREAVRGTTASSGPQDLSGTTVSLVLRGQKGEIVRNSTEGVSVLNPTSGIVRYTPRSSSDLLTARSPYTARFRVQGSTGDIVYFPSGKADVWTVHSL